MEPITSERLYVGDAVRSAAYGSPETSVGIGADIDRKPEVR